MASSMGTRREESVESSLGELMKLEEERVREDEVSRLAQHQAKLRADAEAVSRAMAAEAERLREEAERKVQQEREAHEHAMRFEAFKAAEIERTRVATLEAARNEARRLELEHEQVMARIAGEARGGGVSPLLPASLGFAVALALGVAVELLWLAPRSAEQLARADGAALQSAVAAGVAKDGLAAEQAASARLRKELGAARDRIAALEVSPPGTPAPPAPPHPSPVPRRPRTLLGSWNGEPCLTGDPLCPTIP